MEQLTDTQTAIKRLKLAIQRAESGIVWDTDVQGLPKYIKYDFMYPNGKNGDIDMYIASEYGDVLEVSPLVYEVVMFTDNREQIALMGESYFGPRYHKGYESGIKLRRLELLDFLNKYNLCFSMSVLVRSALDSGMKLNHPYRSTAESIKVLYRKELRERRRGIYSELASAGLATSKWKSEQQAYAIVKRVYSDAVYQYRADWLENQSLDIFIPSLSVGIEYQGAQHYRAVSHFGGEKGLEERLALDEKKKVKCAENGIKLIEWRYDEPLTLEEIQRKIHAEIGRFNGIV